MLGCNWTTNLAALVLGKTAYLMNYGQHLRRLDVNGSHGNRTGDREVWNERSHKHTFSQPGHGRLDPW